jgi:hypothetical protein
LPLPAAALPLVVLPPAVLPPAALPVAAPLPTVPPPAALPPATLPEPAPLVLPEPLAAVPEPEPEALGLVPPAVPVPLAVAPEPEGLVVLPETAPQARLPEPLKDDVADPVEDGAPNPVEEAAVQADPPTAPVAEPAAVLPAPALALEVPLEPVGFEPSPVAGGVTIEPEDAVDDGYRLVGTVMLIPARPAPFWVAAPLWRSIRSAIRLAVEPAPRVCVAVVPLPASGADAADAAAFADERYPAGVPEASSVLAPDERPAWTPWRAARCC